MKVECIQIINPHTNEIVKQSPWLTVGKTYTVLGVEISNETAVSYRLLSDDTSPVLFEARQFRIVAHTIPSTWKFFSNAQGEFCLQPDNWNKRGFWESFFDGDSNAISQFDADLLRIEKEAE